MSAASPAATPAAALAGDSMGLPRELSAKQVRELRRLCRKTANRAEYDDRSVQVRQIASILAMATPSLADFAPDYEARSELRDWLDSVRADGADWRDERILLPAAVAELRDWDRLLKLWARQRCFLDDDEEDINQEQEKMECKTGKASATVIELGGGRCRGHEVLSPTSDAFTPNPRRVARALESMSLDHRPSGSTISKTPVRTHKQHAWFNSSPVSSTASPATVDQPAVNTPVSREQVGPSRTRRFECIPGTPLSPTLDIASPEATPRPKLVPAASFAASCLHAVYDPEEYQETHITSSEENAVRLGASFNSAKLTNSRPSSKLSISHRNEGISADCTTRGLEPGRFSMSAPGNEENVPPSTRFMRTPSRRTLRLDNKDMSSSITSEPAPGASRSDNSNRDWASLRNLRKPLKQISSNHQSQM
jgi:hypothetical protein